MISFCIVVFIVFIVFYIKTRFSFQKLFLFKIEV